MTKFLERGNAEKSETKIVKGISEKKVLFSIIKKEILHILSETAVTVQPPAKRKEKDIHRETGKSV